MADHDPGLTDADRKAIADIRRELDAEFGPLEEALPLDLDEDTEADNADVEELTGSEWSSRPGVVAAFVAGVLLGALVGGVGTFVWLRPPPADVAPPSPSAAVPPSATSPSHEDSPAASAPDQRAENRGAAVTSLQAALDRWLDATRRRDIPAQMRFYPSRVPVYYTWRDVPRAAVRAEKRKVFGATTRLLISTDTPTIEVAPDGAAAVTRFRKRYVIEGPAIERQGEVLQELRWERTPAGWMIVGERDARVIASE